MTEDTIKIETSSESVNVAAPQEVAQDSPWIFRGRCVRVVDGDTYDILVDCGFSIYHRIRVRLRGVDTPEIFGKNACEEGRLAAESVTTSILDKEVLIRTYKTAASTYGRWEADVFFHDMYGTVIDLGKFLVLNGFGKQVDVK